MILSKTLGIVAEYNPFHNGHYYQLEQAKKNSGCDYTVAVICGNYTHKGDVSVIDKWKKTEMALKSGIDLVIELPVIYSVSNSGNYAEGAIKILDSLKIIDTFSFGVDNADLELIDIVADTLYKEPKELLNLLKENMKKNNSFSESRKQALLSYLNNPELYTNILENSINFLAVEYLIALKRNKSNMTPLAVQRGVTNLDHNHIATGYTDSSTIRSMLFNKENIRSLIPESSFDILKDSIKNREMIGSMESFRGIIIYNLRKMTIEEISKIPEVNGFEKDLKKFANRYNNLYGIIESMKLKGCAEGQIKRILLYILLNITKEDIEMSKKVTPYTRVLGYNSNGEKILNSIKKENPKINIVTSVDDFMKSINSKDLLRLISKDIFASNIYTLAYRTNGSAGLDFTNDVIKI